MMAHLTQHNYKGKWIRSLLLYLLQSGLWLPGLKIPKPFGHQPPIAELLIYRDMFVCVGCDYATTSEAHLNAHWTRQKDEAHPAVRKIGRYFDHMRTAQSWFKDIGCSFWAVYEDLDDLPAEDPFRVYLDKFASKIIIPPPPVPLTQNDTPLMLQETNWHIHLQAYVEDNNLRNHLLELIHLAGTLPFPQLRSLCTAYMALGGKTAREAPHRFRQALHKYPP
jgi:hypothetical protein